MTERERALADVAALARQHQLRLDEIAAAMGHQSPAGSEQRWRGVIVTVLGVLGGTFVFAGVGVFIALQWDDMNSFSRVVVTLGSGVAALVLAVMASGDRRFAKAATPLFLMAGALEPTGMMVAFEEFGKGGDWRTAVLVVCGTMAAQFAGVFAKVGRSAPLFLTVLFAAMCCWTAFEIVDLDRTVGEIVLGASLVLAAIHISRTRHRDITGVWFFVGSAALLHGTFDALEKTPLDIVFLLVAAGVVYLSVIVHSRALLAVGTLAVLAYTAWFTGEHFAESIGWPLALIAFGIFMIGLSALAFRIDRDYVRARPARGAAPLP